MTSLEVLNAVAKKLHCVTQIPLLGPHSLEVKSLAFLLFVSTESFTFLREFAHPYLKTHSGGQLFCSLKNVQKTRFKIMPSI